MWFIEFGKRGASGGHVHRLLFCFNAVQVLRLYIYIFVLFYLFILYVQYKKVENFMCLLYVGEKNVLFCGRILYT